MDENIKMITSQHTNLVLSEARFEKVSFNEFMESYTLESSEEQIRRIYDEIRLPRRGTSLSAGYDFYAPYSVNLTEGVPTLMPTGIRVFMNPGWFLMCVPRSGLAFKFGVRLRNTAGIIDADYSFADNEGHIKALLVSDTAIRLNSGDRFMQGIFLPFGITNDDDPMVKARTGGFGSTGK